MGSVRSWALVALLAAAGCGALLDLDAYEERLDEVGAGGGAAGSENPVGGTGGAAAGGEGGDRGGAGGAGGGAGGVGGTPSTGTIQIPANAANNEGNSGNSSPFGGTEQRFQSVYGETLLTGLPVGAVIKGMRFRLDQGQGSFAMETIGNLEIRLSTSRKPPGSLSMTFANNRGLDEVIVRTGTFTIDPADYPSGSSPNDFGALIEFTDFFTYTGGPLLLEMGVTALMSGRNVDNIDSVPTEDSQSYYANAYAATVGVGTPFFDLIVVEYEFDLPPQ